MVNRFIKLLSMFLAVVLLVNMLPLGIFAEEFVGSLSAQETVTTPQAQKSDTHVVAELTDKRTQYTKEFLLSNGLHMATVYADPVHYEKDGQWAEIDNTLKVAKNGTVINTAGVLNVSFPNQLSGNNCVTIEKDGYTLSFYMAGELRSSGELMTAAMGTATTEQLAVNQMQTATASIQAIDTTALEQGYMYPEAAPKKLDSQLRYNDIYTNTDVVYDLQSDTVKESIVMDTYSSTLRGYRYTLNVGQMIPVLDEWGDITFYAPDGETAIMTMPAPFLMDANNEYNDDIQVQLTGKGSTYTLTYLLPQQWLAAEDRAWPVILDPVVKASRDKLAIRDQTVCEKKPISETKTVLDAGYEKDRGKVRAYLKYLELPRLTSSDVVLEATFTLTKVLTSNTSKTVEVHKVTGEWPEESLTWANKPAFAADISDYKYVRKEGLYNWTVTEIVRSWYTEANNGLMIKMSNDVESGSSGDYFRQFYSSDTGKYNRPTLQVVFRNNNGIEDYWDYTSTAAGRAGTGYVNNFTGNLVWVRNDMGFDGNRMPVSIDHVYNANDAIVYTDAEGQVNNANDSGGNYFGLGVGWRTNYHQRVFQWECDDASGASGYYIWEDDDGTDHYFSNEDGNYIDEDNLQLTLYVEADGYRIVDGDEYTSHFDSVGRLTSIINNQTTPSSINIIYVNNTTYEIDYITDGAGRKYDFTYNNGLLSSIIYRGSNTTGNYYEVRFEYNSNSMLTKIVDNACDDPNCEACKAEETNKEIVYTYNLDGILDSAKDIDGYTISYTYTRDLETVSQDPDETTAWEPPYLVETIRESDNGKTGGQLTFSYGYNETRVQDHNENVQIMQFNDWGNMVNIMDSKGHAQSADYTANSHNDTGTTNQMILSSKMQNTVANLLNHSSFETGNSWTVADSVSTGTVSTAQNYYGAKSLLVKGTVHNTTFTIPKGQTYTLSVYVKANETATIGFKVGSEIVSSTTIPVGTDFARYEVSYTNETDSDVQVIPYLSTGNSNGAYFDCAQLENMPTASRYNLVENGDFGYSNGWTLHDDCTSLDGYVTTEKTNPVAPQLGKTAFSITGNRTKTKGIQQNVKVSGTTGDSFVLAGWAEGYAVPLGKYDDDTRNFSIRARFKYTDGTYSNYFYADFLPTIHGWQFSSVSMVAEKPYSQITVAAVYHHNVNTIYLDGIQLFKEEFGTKYEYDSKGNLTSVKDIQGGITTYTYNQTTNDLTKIVENGVEKFINSYDNHHNLENSTTEDNMEYQFDYDAYGNIIKETIDNGIRKITTEYYYADQGNRLDYTVDTLGNITRYGYDPNTNMLLWVQYPEDTDGTNGNPNTRTVYYYDSMYRARTESRTTNLSAAMSVEYVYDNDYLTAIQTPTTTYQFSYGDFGLQESVSVGNSTLINYTYTNDSNHFLHSIDFSNGGSIEYEYDKQGQILKQVYEDGVTVEYLYNNDGDLAKIKDSATGWVTTQFYDALGQPLKYEEVGNDYHHSVSYIYGEDDSQLDHVVEVINNTTTVTSYTYDEKSRIATMSTGNTTVVYSYDDFDRIIQKVTKHGAAIYKTELYTYTTTANNTSSQIATHTIICGGMNTAYSYTYDGNGNIVAVDDGTSITSYEYDSANQLVRENNQKYGYSTVWTYDNAGNIKSREDHPYTTGALTEFTVTDSKEYGYTDPNWGDLLTSYDGKSIVYDEVGNPLNDGNWLYEWEHGRQLKSMSKINADTTWAYEYTADGMRTKRSNGTKTYEYTYNGFQLTQMRAGSDIYDFTYDTNGFPLTLSKTYVSNTGGLVTDTYYYITNIQGDVLGLRDSTGTEVAAYTYDAWGKCTGIIADGIEDENPLRYRGYVYDVETQLYYVCSRYYNSETGRWLNCDDINMLTLNQGHQLSNNLFSYCENNPTTNKDLWGYAKINIKWLGHAVDTIIWLIPAILAVAKIWKSVSKSAIKLVSFGTKLISYGKQIFKRFDDRLYCAFAKESTYRIVKTIGVLAGAITIVSSIGSIVQYIVDILDGKWDGYLDTKRIKPKLDLTRDY